MDVKTEEFMETICCCCNRIKIGKSWKKQLPDDRKKTTHGYCPRCFAKMMDKVDTRIAQQVTVAC